MKKWITAILAVCLLLSLTACSFYSLMMDPDDYTAVSYNIVWTQCEDEIEKDLSSHYSRVFYRITDIPITDFVACKWRPAGIGSDEFTVLMQHKDFEGNPELDASCCKLFTGSFFGDDWLTYGQQIMKTELLTIDPAIATQLMDSITAAAYVEESDEPNGSASEYLLDSDDNVLRITFAIKDYEHLFWIAYILKCEDQYYIEIKEDLYRSQYVLCSNELAAVLTEVCEEYGLQ
jgi:hypothetical protein